MRQSKESCHFHVGCAQPSLSPAPGVFPAGRRGILSSVKGGKAVPWKFCEACRGPAIPGFKFLAQWAAAAFCSCFLVLSGLLGSWNKGPGSAFADWRGRGVWKVSFLGKRAGSAAWGEKHQTKQLLFPSGSEWGVMSRWS